MELCLTVYRRDRRKSLIIYYIFREGWSNCLPILSLYKLKWYCRANQRDNDVVCCLHLLSKTLTYTLHFS